MSIQPRPDTQSDAARVAFRLSFIAGARSEAGRADSQAGIIAAGLLAALTVIATRPLPAGIPALAVWWAAMTLGGTSLTLLGLVVYPKRPPRATVSPTTIQHVWHVEAAERLGASYRLDDALDHTMIDVVAATEQVRHISKIVRDGFDRTAWGILLIPPMIILFGVSAILGQVI